MYLDPSGLMLVLLDGMIAVESESTMELLLTMSVLWRDGINLLGFVGILSFGMDGTTEEDVS
jgi:hypothetical protein